MFKFPINTVFAIMSIIQVGFVMIIRSQFFLFLHMLNKWQLDRLHNWIPTANEPEEVRESSLLSAARSQEMGHSPQSSTPHSVSKSTNLLYESLRDLCLDEATVNDLIKIPPAVTSLIWKLLSQCHSVASRLNLRIEASARIENENKLLRTRLAKLTEEVSRLKSELTAAQSESRRLEGFYNDKLSDLSKSRLEWERTALDYKDREKQFVAELKRKDAQFGRLQDRARRSLSVVQPRTVDRPAVPRTLQFNEIHIPPLEKAPRW